jgi:hypothetical protein
MSAQALGRPMHDLTGFEALHVALSATPFLDDPPS